MNMSVRRYLVKVNRFSAWCLLAVIVAKLVTGYGITGDHAWIRALGSAETHAALHRALALPAMVLLAVHVSLSAFFAVLRWRVRGRES